MSDLLNLWAVPPERVLMYPAPGTATEEEVIWYEVGPTNAPRTHQWYSGGRLWHRESMFAVYVATCSMLHPAEESRSSPPPMAWS